MPKNKKAARSRSNSPEKSNRRSPAVTNEQIFLEIQDMFAGKVEAEVVHMILTECEWRVEEAIDMLFSLMAEADEEETPASKDENSNKLFELASGVLNGQAEEWAPRNSGPENRASRNSDGGIMTSRHTELKDNLFERSSGEHVDTPGVNAECHRPSTDSSPSTSQDSRAEFNTDYEKDVMKFYQNKNSLVPSPEWLNPSIPSEKIMPSRQNPEHNLASGSDICSILPLCENLREESPGSSIHGSQALSQVFSIPLLTSLIAPDYTKSGTSLSVLHGTTHSCQTFPPVKDNVTIDLESTVTSSPQITAKYTSVHAGVNTSQSSVTSNAKKLDSVSQATSMPTGNDSSTLGSHVSAEADAILSFRNLGSSKPDAVISSPAFTSDHPNANSIYTQNGGADRPVDYSSESSSQFDFEEFLKDMNGVYSDDTSNYFDKKDEQKSNLNSLVLNSANILQSHPAYDTGSTGKETNLGVEVKHVDFGTFSRLNKVDDHKISAVQAEKSRILETVMGGNSKSAHLHLLKDEVPLAESHMPLSSCSIISSMSREERRSEMPTLKTLSADAPVFVPRVFAQLAPNHSSEAFTGSITTDPSYPCRPPISPHRFGVPPHRFGVPPPKFVLPPPSVGSKQSPTTGINHNSKSTQQPFFKTYQKTNTAKSSLVSPAEMSPPSSHFTNNSGSLRGRSWGHDRATHIQSRPRESVLFSDILQNSVNKSNAASKASLSHPKPVGIKPTQKAREEIDGLLKRGEKILVILRGCPGSGKSTLARQLRFDGVILGSDDFFMRGNFYEYDRGLLGDAHQWNQERCGEAMRAGSNPIIVDNTNTQRWEMKPYVLLAQQYSYIVELMEPQTRWKWKARELAKRNSHDVPLEAIQRMLQRYEHNVNVESILQSVDKRITLNRKETSSEPIEKPLEATDEHSLPTDEQDKGGEGDDSSDDVIIESVEEVDVNDDDEDNTEKMACHSNQDGGAPIDLGSDDVHVTADNDHDMCSRGENVNGHTIEQSVFSTSEGNDKVLTEGESPMEEEEESSELGGEFGGTCSGSDATGEEEEADDEESLADSCISESSNIPKRENEEQQGGEICEHPVFQPECATKPVSGNSCMLKEPLTLLLPEICVKGEDITATKVKSPELECSGMSEDFHRIQSDILDMVESKISDPNNRQDLAEISAELSALVHFTPLSQVEKDELERSVRQTLSGNFSQHVAKPDGEQVTCASHASLPNLRPGETTVIGLLTVREGTLGSLQNGVAIPKSDATVVDFDNQSRNITYTVSSSTNEDILAKKENRLTEQNSPTGSNSTQNAVKNTKDSRTTSPWSSGPEVDMWVDPQPKPQRQRITNEQIETDEGSSKELDINSVAASTVAKVSNMVDKSTSVNCCKQTENCYPPGNKETVLPVLMPSNAEISVAPCTSALQDHPKGRKIQKRRKFKSQPQPFLDEKTKEDFLNSSWSFPSFDSSDSGDGGVKYRFGPSKPFAKGRNSGSKTIVQIEHGTNTSPRDFNVLHCVNQGFDISQSELLFQVRPSLSRDINSDRETSDPEISTIQSRPKYNRSTSTDDLQEEMGEKTGLEFLQSCFTDVPIDDLKDILASCANNVDRAVTILLDWGYDSAASPLRRKKIAMGRLQSREEDDINMTISPLTIMAVQQSPKLLSLTDLCSKCLQLSGTASGKQIETILISSSDKRLKIIEKLTRRTQRLLSIELQSGMDTADVWVRDENYALCSYSDSSEGSDTNSDTESDVKEGGDILVDHDMPGTNLTEETCKLAVGSSAQSAEDTMTVQLDQTLIEQLISMFGPLRPGPGGDLSIPGMISVKVDHDAARQLHCCLQKTVEENLLQRKAERAKQTLEDESLARRMQDEENFRHVRRPRTPESKKVVKRHRRKILLPSNRPQTLLDQHTQISLSRQSTQSPWQPGQSVQSLREIMQEERAKQISKEEYQKILEAKGDTAALATRLKRQKLQEMFPGVDEAMLEDFFEANGFTLGSTISALQDMLGSESRPQNPEMAAEYDKYLLNLAKENSLRDAPKKLPTITVIQTGSSKYQSIDTPDYQDFRAEANTHHRLRQECFQKAQEAYRRGMKDVASFYSQQGHLHSEKLREAHNRASEKILEYRNGDLEQTSMIDLHGLHPDEAVHYLSQILTDRQQDLRRNPNCQRCYLSVITGKGMHSRGGVARVKPAVLDFLKKSCYGWTEQNSGVLRILIKAS